MYDKNSTSMLYDVHELCRPVGEDCSETRTTTKYFTESQSQAIHSKVSKF